MKTSTFLFMLCMLCSIFAFGQAVEANLLGNWNDSTLVSTQYDNTYNEIWGYAVDGREFAIIGSTAGTHFIEVTNPNHPTEVYFVQGADYGQHIVHRDYHTLGNLLYAVSDEGESSLQIMDLDFLAQDSVAVLYDSWDLLIRAHNIFIDENRLLLYAFDALGGDPVYSAVRLYYLEDPLEPLFIGEYYNFGGLEARHVHDGYVREGIAFLNCGNEGFAIVDFTDPFAPVTLSTMTEYQQQGYNHSGWLSEDCAYYYMADETHNKDLKVLDVSNPCEIEVVGTFNAESLESSSIPHNTIVACDYLYVSYYYDGLQVYDISDPAQPERVLYYDTHEEPNDESYKGNWGVYPFLPSGNILISDMQKGLLVLEGMGDGCASTSAENGCSVTCDEVSAVEELDFVSTFSIEPNPVQQYLNVNIKLTEKKSEVKLDLLDITGKVVQHLEDTNLYEGENHLNFHLNESLHAGLYLLRMNAADFTLTKKFLKK